MLLVPVISTEAVLAADPEVIGGRDRGTWPSGKSGGMETMAAPEGGWRATICLSSLPTSSRAIRPRILDGAQQLCEQLEAARAKRK